MQYAWDQPAAREKKLMLMIGDARRVVDIKEIGVLVPFRFQVRPDGTFILVLLTSKLGSTTNACCIAGCTGGPTQTSVAYYSLCSRAQSL